MNRNTSNSYNKAADHVIRFLPFVITVCGCIFWLGGCLESRSAKAARLQQSIRPIEARLKRVEELLDSHRASDGHSVIMSQVRSLEAEIRRIHKDGG